MTCADQNMQKKKNRCSSIPQRFATLMGSPKIGHVREIILFYKKRTKRAK
jgi:hypothetical protein